MKMSEDDFFAIFKNLEKISSNIDEIIPYIGIETKTGRLYIDMYESNITVVKLLFNNTINEDIDYFIYECNFGKNIRTITTENDSYIINGITSFYNFLKKEGFIK